MEKRSVVYQKIENLSGVTLIKKLKTLFRSMISYVDFRIEEIKHDPTPEQIQSDWAQTVNTKKDFIKNKPVIPAAQVQSDWEVIDEESKSFIKNKPTIPTVPAQVQADWNLTETANKGFIKNKPKLFTAADLATGDVPITLKDSAGKKYTLTVGDDGVLSAVAQ